MVASAGFEEHVGVRPGGKQGREASDQDGGVGEGSEVHVDLMRGRASGSHRCAPWASRAVWQWLNFAVD